MNLGEKKYLWKSKIFHYDIFKTEAVIFCLTCVFFFKLKTKSQSKSFQCNSNNILFKSILRFCFLFASVRETLKKMFQSDPNWKIFTSFLSSYWTKMCLFHTVFPIIALLRLLEKCMQWEERWCRDRNQTVERSEQGFGFSHSQREERSQKAGSKAK